MVSNTFNLGRPAVSGGGDSFVGAVDPAAGKIATANAFIETASSGLDAKIAFDIESTQDKVRAEIEAFTAQGARDTEIEGIAEELDAAPVVPTEEESKALNVAKARLSKLRRARESGNISETEMRAKVSDITREGISLWGGLGSQFREAEARTLGTYQGNILLERERRDLKATSAASTSKLVDARVKETLQAGGVRYGVGGVDLTPAEILGHPTNRKLMTDIAYNKRAVIEVTGDAAAQKRLWDNDYDTITDSTLVQTDNLFNDIIVSDLSVDEALKSISQGALAQKAALTKAYEGASGSPSFQAAQAMIDDLAAKANANVKGTNRLAVATNQNSVAKQTTLRKFREESPIAYTLAIGTELFGTDIATLAQSGPQFDSSIGEVVSVIGRISAGELTSSNASERTIHAVEKTVVKEVVRLGNSGFKGTKEEIKAAIDMHNGLLSSYRPRTSTAQFQVIEWAASDEFKSNRDSLDSDIMTEFAGRNADYLAEFTARYWRENFDPSTMKVVKTATGISVTGPNTKDINAAAAIFNTHVRAAANLINGDPIEMRDIMLNVLQQQPTRAAAEPIKEVETPKEALDFLSGVETVPNNINDGEYPLADGRIFRIVGGVSSLVDSKVTA